MTARAWGRGVWRRVATRDVPDAVKALVDARQGGRRCARCGSGEALELDHRRPLSRGGDHHWSNLQWLCRPCNRAKGARAYADPAHTLATIAQLRPPLRGAPSA